MGSVLFVYCKKINKHVETNIEKITQENRFLTIFYMCKNNELKHYAAKNVNILFFL
jgi:hypothetical protein